MLVTVLLCLISTIGFCLGARLLISVMGSAKDSAKNSGWLQGRHNPNARFNARARRVARTYSVFSLAILTLVALIGAVQSYLELFTG